MSNLDSTQITIRFVRAHGPVTVGDIAEELTEQCTGITSLHHGEVEASRVVAQGLHVGWLQRYDEDPDAFVLRTY